MRGSAIAGSAMVLLALVLATVPSSATTITVADDGSGMYLTIQEGIDAASPGDTVEVAAGTYTGLQNRDLDFAGDAITLIGTVGRPAPMIDCEFLGRGFFFHSGEDTTALVSGFRVVHAAADTGAGAYCGNGSSPKFVECRFEVNAATVRGGGLYCRNSSPVVRGCWFIENEASGGTFVYGGGMACEAGSAPLVVGTSFQANTSMNGGGAVYCHSSPAAFADCEFARNNVGTYGSNGAGVRVVQTTGATLTECTFLENGLGQETLGGGLYVSGSTITVTDCEFTGNRAGQGASIHFTTGSSGTVSGCTFVRNTSGWSAAAGISFYTSSLITVSNCTFVANNDYHLFVDTCSPTIEYCILAFATDLGAMACDQGTETPHVHHCFVYGNAGNDVICGGNDHDIEYVDPRLCGFPTGDYTLCADSPCLPGATWPSLVGALGQGCDPCGSPVESATWGAVKALFR